MKWRQKSAIQNLMGRLPPRLGNPIYYQLQRRFGGLRSPTPVSRLTAGIEIARLIYKFEHTVESKVFLEVGTGHRLDLPLSLWLCGASEITTVDLNPYLKEKLVMGDIDYLRRHQEEVRNLFAFIPRSPAFDERFERLIARADCLPELLSTTKIRYCAPADAGCLALAAESVDYHISFTVLEHIPSDVLKGIFEEGRRLLKPDGLFVHYIDFSDHFAHSDQAISSVNFLQFSESEWESLAGNRYMFHNRLRVDEFRALLLGLDLEILSMDIRVDETAVDLLRKGFPLSERFRTKDWSTNAAMDAWVVATRGSAALPRATAGKDSASPLNLFAGRGPGGPREGKRAS